MTSTGRHAERCVLEDFKQGSRDGTADPRLSSTCPSLKVQYDLEQVSFISNTSYFYHKDYAALDYTNYFAGIFDGNPHAVSAGRRTVAGVHTNHQNAFTEEARLQSTTVVPLFDWTVGVFYSQTPSMTGSSPRWPGDLHERLRQPSSFVQYIPTPPTSRSPVTPMSISM